MKYTLSPLAFTVGASAAVLKRSDCCFHLTASGGASGTVGQLNDGQNRVGGGYDATQYCISSAGGITDSSGRGCILTPPTTQFQCDEGASPTTGFSIDEGGEVTYNGSTQFYACPAADGEYNIYTRPVEGQDKCVENTLSTEGAECASGGQQSSPAATPSSAPVSMPVPSAPAPSSPAVESSSDPPVVSTPPIVPSGSPETVTSTLTRTTTECPTTSGTPASSPPAQSPPPVPSSEQSPPAGPPPSNTQPAPESPPATEHTTPTTTTQHHATSTHTSIQSVTAPTRSPSQPAGTPSTPVPSQPSPPSTPAAGTPTSGGGPACPTDLSGPYQSPHLIVPVNASAPTAAYGTRYDGTVGSRTCSLFNFDIPAGWAGATCAALFLLPRHAELETSDYRLSGGGGGTVVFRELEAPAGEGTTWESKPAGRDVGEWALEEGKRGVVAAGECRAGETVAYEMCAEGGLELEWFEDWNPSPIGLFVRKC